MLTAEVSASARPKSRMTSSAKSRSIFAMLDVLHDDKGRLVLNTLSFAVILHNGARRERWPGSVEQTVGAQKQDSISASGPALPADAAVCAGLPSAFPRSDPIRR